MNKEVNDIIERLQELSKTITNLHDRDRKIDKIISDIEEVGLDVPNYIREAIGYDKVKIDICVKEMNEKLARLKEIRNACDHDWKEETFNDIRICTKCGKVEPL